MAERFIIKRSGERELYRPEKIISAMKKSFDSCSTQADEAQFESLLSEAERKMERAGADSVEQIQDIVEETLMEQGYFREAKAYILYRQERSQLRSIRQELASSLEIEGFEEAPARYCAGVFGGSVCAFYTERKIYRILKKRYGSG